MVEANKHNRSQYLSILTEMTINHFIFFVNIIDPCNVSHAPRVGQPNGPFTTKVYPRLTVRVLTPNSQKNMFKANASNAIL